METHLESRRYLERRGELRLSGRQVEGIELQLIENHTPAGWDQETRWAGEVGNLSWGGVEARLAKDFPHPVDTKVFGSVKFPGGAGWLRIPSIIRHLHFDGEDLILGLQFLWSHRFGPDREAEEELLRQILNHERTP